MIHNAFKICVTYKHTSDIHFPKKSNRVQDIPQRVPKSNKRKDNFNFFTIHYYLILYTEESNKIINVIPREKDFISYQRIILTYRNCYHTYYNFLFAKIWGVNAVILEVIKLLHIILGKIK